MQDLGFDWRRRAIARHGEALPSEANRKLKTDVGSAPESEKTSSAGPRQQHQSRIRLGFVQQRVLETRKDQVALRARKNTVNMQVFVALAAMIRQRCNNEMPEMLDLGYDLRYLANSTSRAARVRGPGGLG